MVHASPKAVPHQLLTVFNAQLSVPLVLLVHQDLLLQEVFVLSLVLRLISLVPLLELVSVLKLLTKAVELVSAVMLTASPAPPSAVQHATRHFSPVEQFVLVAPRTVSLALLHLSALIVSQDSTQMEVVFVSLSALKH